MTTVDLPVALVTGSRGGLGSAIVTALLNDGYRVVGIDRSPTTNTIVKTDRHKELVVDLTQEVEIREVVEHIDATWGGLDAVANVAGINYHAAIEDTDLERWLQVMAINVLGMVSIIKYATPLLRKSDRAAIVNMGSISAVIGSHGYSSYVASKAAVEGLTRSLALELAPVRVTALAPGWVDTPFSDAGIALADDPEEARNAAGASHALGRIAHAYEIAEAARWLLSPAASFVTGSILVIDGGYLIKN